MGPRLCEAGGAGQQTAKGGGGTAFTAGSAGVAFMFVAPKLWAHGGQTWRKGKRRGKSGSILYISGIFGPAGGAMVCVGAVYPLHVQAGDTVIPRCAA